MNQAASFPAKSFPEILQSAQDSTSPFSIHDSASTRAAKVKQLLVDLSRDEDDKELRSAFRATAEFFRESFFGLTKKQIRTRIKNCLEDYFDGEEYRALEIDNIFELTGIKPEKLQPVLEKMVKQKIVLQGRRRRWNEPGEHYNAIYKLRK